MKHYTEEHFKKRAPVILDDGIHTHDSLSQTLTGQATSIENYARIVQSRADLDRMQSIMEAHFATFGIRLSKPSDITSIDGVTEEKRQLKVHTHTKLNPRWQHAQARKRRNEFLHFIKDQGIRINQLHYFTMPAADRRLPIGVNLDYYFKNASARMRRTLQQIKRKFSDSVMPFVTALEWTVCPVEDIYLHYNVIMYIPNELHVQERLPEHDRRSIVWKNSWVSYAHRSLGLGQFLEFFNGQWKQGSQRYVSYNGPVKDAADTMLYINKPFDPEPLSDHPKITEWLYNETKGLALYHTKTLFKEWRSQLKKNKHTVFECRNETYVREVSQSDRELYDLDVEDQDEKDDQDDDDNDDLGRLAENKILGRIAPTYNYRFKTPSLLVMNYTNSPRTIEGKRRLMKINDLKDECKKHFHANTRGRVTIKEIIAERDILERLFIYVTTDDTSFESKIAEFHKRMLHDYYLPSLGSKPDIDLDNIPDPHMDKRITWLREEGKLPPELPENPAEPSNLSPEALMAVHAFNQVFG